MRRVTSLSRDFEYLERDLSQILRVFVTLLLYSETARLSR